MSVALPLRRRDSNAGTGVRTTAARRRKRLWVELLAVAWLAWVYDAITNLAHLRLQAALANARGVLHLEQTLHIDPEHSLDQWVAGHHTLGTVLSGYYDNAHWGLTLALLAWLWWRSSELYRPLRNSLVLVNLLAFIVFWRYPVAPPRMLAGFTDVISSHAAGPNFHGGALASNANELAAMPSLHMAWAAWCGLVLWRLSGRRLVRALALLYPCVTAFVVIATGNHFVLDLLAGLATLALAQLLLSAPRAIASAWRRSSAARARLLGRLERGRRELEKRAPAPGYRSTLRTGRGARTPLRAGVESGRE